LRWAAPYLRWGGLLRNIDLFDPMFFRISGREAELTDPQHRVFLTEVWRAWRMPDTPAPPWKGRTAAFSSAATAATTPT
ncbi:beta-ketoacyl synthase N-terminal-like domain-containing protein, partial [Methylogaea oryzae]|uniref:beta-ketoacyl synthase N-terminal-like domain-containing protein n=1 Tax=Methylogaea oryzae TaxID=1295382 RepID=UPI00138F64BF